MVIFVVVEMDSDVVDGSVVLEVVVVTLVVVVVRVVIVVVVLMSSIVVYIVETLCVDVVVVVDIWLGTHFVVASLQRKTQLKKTLLRMQ